MSGILLIRDLAVVLVFAGMAAWVCQRLGLSSVVGYLIAGALIGPHTPPFALVTDLDRIQTLAQIGLVFLIFSIGLNLSLSRLKRLGFSTLIATIVTAFIVLNGCRLFGWAAGWKPTASLFLAAMVMVSSSAIISKVLEELNLTHERPGQLALAVTVFEDIVAITMLTLLASLVQFGGAKPPPLLPTLGALGAFIVLLVMLSLLVVPRLLARLHRDAQPDIRTLVVGGILLALSFLAVRLGYSLALGAFIFGVIVGSTRFKNDVERSFEGLRQLFGAVFFVAVGMLVDFSLLRETWPQMLLITGLALLLRPFAASIGFLVTGSSPRESVQAALALAPLGEFTFIIAQLGVESGVLAKSFYPVAAGASLLTALAAPVLTRKSEALGLRVANAQPQFLARAITTYQHWLQRLRNRRTAGILWRLARKRLLQVGLQMVLVSAVLLFVRPIYEAARAGFDPDEDSLFEPMLPFLFWTVFGLVLLAPLISIWRNLSALSIIIADAVSFGSPRQTLVRPWIERILSAVLLVLLAIWLLAVLPSGWSLIGPAGAVLLLLILVATVFWRRFIKLHTRFEVQLVNRLHQASQVTSASAWPDLLPQQTADWNLEIEEVTLPRDTAQAGKTLGQLAIRANYGCSVVGIDRQGFSIVNPSAHTQVYPEDKLLLLGGHEELVRASRALVQFTSSGASEAGFEDLTMETIRVPPGCTMAGQALIDLDLIRKWGVQIAGIRQGPRQNLSPTGRDHFLGGDELLILGTHAQIRGFSEAIAACTGAPDTTANA